MTKLNRRKLRNVRPKAFAGEAIIGAGITAAASVASAIMQANAAKDAANVQAEATRQSALENANALQRQSDNNNLNQERQLAFSREQNELNRDLQKEFQMNLQFLAGRQNENERLEAAKIQVKHGGSMRRKLRNAGVTTSESFLRGNNNNLPFTVTDGGGVIPIVTTPEGYDLYEIVGNDHEHYHKTKSGKSKTGVGIRFAGSKTIEGEGNQNTNQGELMLVTPDDAKFISKHSIKGFNPTKAVLSGMHPIDAFNTQEEIKAADGINVDYYTPVGNVNSKTVQTRKLRDGGRIKRFNTSTANLIGSGITGIGNIAGALISNTGNDAASSILTKGYNDAGNIISDAYGRLRGIDMSAIRRSDYSAPHAMAAIRLPYVNTASDLALVDRSLQRKNNAIRRNSVSGAAMLNRLSRAESDAYDMRSQVFNNATKQREAILQYNIAQINQVAKENANRDVQTNKDYASTYLNLLQYNNDIANERITGSAQAQADALTSSMLTRSNTAQANASSWANAISNSLNGFSNTLATNAKMANDLEMSKYGWTSEQLLNYTINNNDLKTAKILYQRYKDNPSYKTWAEQLVNQFGEDNLNA